MSKLENLCNKIPSTMSPNGEARPLKQDRMCGVQRNTA